MGRQHISQITNDGFTIIELMIALSVLATILVISSIMMLQIGKLYTKAITQSNLQAATRNISSSITSAIEFGGSQPITCGNPQGCQATSDKSVYSFCVGGVRYSYRQNVKLGTDSATHTATNNIFWRDAYTPANNTCLTPLEAGGTGGYELAPPNTRVTRFTVEPDSSATGSYTITLWMAYGDSDLLQWNGQYQSKPACIGGTGSQFCALSFASTTAITRVQGGVQ